MMGRDRGYDDRDTYTSTVHGAMGAAAAHALDDAEPWDKPTKAELEVERRQERAAARRRWRR